ncbi:MAG: DUF5716 family protein [Clostridia bacterium]
MSLFEVVPSDLFSVLASPNKAIYAEALLLLHEMFKYSVQIEKRDYLTQLIARVEDADFVQENDEAIPIATASQRAHYILARLMSTGWVQEESKEGSFIQVLTLHHYSIKILMLLSNLICHEQVEYNSLVFATYSGLYHAIHHEPERTYDALLSAQQNTGHLIDELKSLYHSIRDFHQALQDSTQFNAILSQHFDGYMQLIDQIYHPIKTMDSFARYHQPIQDMLYQIQSNAQFMQYAIDRARLIRSFEGDEQARESIEALINEVVQSYERVQTIIDEIDIRHASYTRSSTEKMRYMLTADHTLKGKLIKLMGLYAAGAHQEQIFTTFLQGVHLMQEESLTPQALYHKTARMQRKLQPVEPVVFTQHEDRQAIEATMDKLQGRFGTAKVRKFMQELLKHAQQVHMADIPITTDEDFLFLLLGAVRAYEKDMPQQILVEEGTVQSNGYLVPNLTFIKKEKDHDLGRTV